MVINDGSKNSGEKENEVGIFSRNYFKNEKNKWLTFFICNFVAMAFNENYFSSLIGIDKERYENKVK